MNLVGQVSDRTQGQIWAHKQLCGGLGYLRALSWLQGLAMSVQTAMEVSDRHRAGGAQKSTAREGLALSTHSCGSQLQGSRPESCICAA